MDGVLFDSAEFHRLSWHRLAGEAGFRLSDAQFWKSFGRTNPEILANYLGPDVPRAELLRLSERKEELFREEARARLRFFPGLEPLLAELRDRGFRMALGTSTPRTNVLFYYRELGLDRFFDACACADDVRRGKPDPEVFLKAAEKLGLPPPRCVVLEDAYPGLEAARAAGMKSIAVATTHTSEELRRETSADLILPTAAALKPEDVLRLLGG
jgi:HAD superfamily hydrolase (TIGR01509 family)